MKHNADPPAAVFDKPFAVFMGPQKAGADLIGRYLESRGDVCLPAPLHEIFFFDRHYGRGVEFYKNHFSPRGNSVLFAEVTTTIFDHPDAPARVREMFGENVTLVCPLREPVARSWALYDYYRGYGIVSGSLAEACEAEPQILGSSRYALHLARWRDYFPGGKVKILFYEDLADNKDRYLKNLCDALGLPFSGFGEGLADDAPSMASEDRQFLERHLGGEAAALEALIGPIPQWKDAA